MRKEKKTKEMKKRKKRFHLPSLSRCVFLLVVVVCFYSSRTFAFALATIYRFLAFAFTSRVVWIETHGAYSSREYTHTKRRMLVCYDECRVFDVPVNKYGRIYIYIYEEGESTKKNEEEEEEN